MTDDSRHRNHDFIEEYASFPNVILTDPTMNGTKDPIKKRAKLQDRIACLRHEIAIREDQIAIMEHEIAGLK